MRGRGPRPPGVQRRPDMDEAGARALLERLSTTEQPPSRVDIGLARQRGSTLLRRRRWAMAGAPLLAAAGAAAIVLGIGAITGAGGGAGIPPPPPSRAAHPPFNPPAPPPALRRLPHRGPHNVNSPYSNQTQLQLAVGSAAGGNFELTVWARGACNLDVAQVRTGLRRHHHPLLSCEDARSGWGVNMSRQAPAIAGRPAFWFSGHMLAWAYARHSWATLYVSRRGTPIPAATIVKVAAHVRFAATPKPAVKFPFPRTRVPASLQRAAPPP